MKDLTEILNEISKIVGWWYDLEKGYSNITHLDDVHRRLSGLFFFLSEITAENKSEYLHAKHSRKSNIASIKYELISNKSTVSKAQAEAEASTEDLQKNEVQLEAITERCKIMLSATDKAIEAVRQKISNLKLELNKGNYGT